MGYNCWIMQEGFDYYCTHDFVGRQFSLTNTMVMKVLALEMSFLGVDDRIQPLDYAGRGGLLLQSRVGRKADSPNKRHCDDNFGA